MSSAPTIWLTSAIWASGQMPQITPFMTPTFPSFMPKSVIIAMVGKRPLGVGEERKWTQRQSRPKFGLCGRVVEPEIRENGYMRDLDKAVLRNGKRQRVRHDASTARKESCEASHVGSQTAATRFRWLTPQRPGKPQSALGLRDHTILRWHGRVPGKPLAVCPWTPMACRRPGRAIASPWSARTPLGGARPARPRGRTTILRPSSGQRQYTLL